MKKYLLPHGHPFFKANLHCHTTISDGRLTPAEVKAAYKAQGYSIVAYTDHEIMLAHPELADEEFLPLNGYEYEVLCTIPENIPYKLRKTCHMCLIALEPDNLNHVCWHRTKYLFVGSAYKHRPEAKFQEELPDYERVYSGECISEVMQTARNNGFFVTYNHPNWSREDMADIIHYHGMHALEIYNHANVLAGYPDYNPDIYDAMLRRDMRVYCTAGDDSHGPEHHFGGWTMICAEKLEYRTVTKALEAGHFYASTGPEIHALWFEDEKIHIQCSPAAEILASFGTRKRIRIPKSEGELTEAVIPVEPDDTYVRLTVWDADRNHADTNAYFVEELYAE